MSKMKVRSLFLICLLILTNSFCLVYAIAQLVMHNESTSFWCLFGLASLVFAYNHVLWFMDVLAETRDDA